MAAPAPLRFDETDIQIAGDWTGHIAVFADAEKGLDTVARRIDTKVRKALSRAMASDAWEKLKEGDALSLGWPTGVEARAVSLVKLAQTADAMAVRRAGASLAKVRGSGPLLVLAGSRKHTRDLALGLVLRGYDFTAHKTGDDLPQVDGITLMVNKPEVVAREAAADAALAEGVFFARDLVNEPANVLTTDDFAARLAAMQEIGLDVEILEEDALKDLGMRLLLAVGQGSASPSKVVVMRWMGGGDEPPLALVGKGVVFDTGGVSLKPAAGMEDMTMDMGGAGTVAGVMRTLALRKAKANVVGLVGIVENMNSGTATRPGDVVRSMKGDTVEVINTDAEGRLVLADVLWYAQETYNPSGIIDLATLTGAMLVALGHENAGLFSNDEALSDALIKAGAAEGEGIWRMPLAPAYDKLLKSRVADMKNIGGRWAGSITAAQFLQRFVKEGTPWIHLDIAGTASLKEEGPWSPNGATGWGVMALNRLIADRFEAK